MKKQNGFVLTVISVFLLLFTAKFSGAQQLSNEPATVEFGKVSALPTPEPASTPKVLVSEVKPRPVMAQAKKAVKHGVATPIATLLVNPPSTPEPDPRISDLEEALRESTKATEMHKAEALKLEDQLKTSKSRIARLEDENTYLAGAFFLILVVPSIFFVFYRLWKNREYRRNSWRHNTATLEDTGEETDPPTGVEAVEDDPKTMTLVRKSAGGMVLISLLLPALSYAEVCKIEGVVPPTGVVYQGEESVVLKVLTSGCTNPTAVGVGPGVHFGTPTFADNIITVDVRADYSSKIGRLEFVVLEDGTTPVRSGVTEGSPYLLIYNKGLAALRKEILTKTDKYEKDIASLHALIREQGLAIADLKLQTTNLIGRLSKLVHNLGVRSLGKSGIKGTFGGRETFDGATAIKAQAIQDELAQSAAAEKKRNEEALRNSANVMR